MSKNEEFYLTPSENFQLQVPLGDMDAAASSANAAASRHRFEEYRLRRADETLRRQQADVALFEHFLVSLQLNPGDLWGDISAWRPITWGLVEAFIRWQIQEGYAVPSINIRLSTLKTYARLAAQAGVLPPTEYALIRSVQGYSRREKQRLDLRRTRVRIGLKKEFPVLLTPEQSRRLKQQPDTPQGRRDALMMCLLLDHGLRVGELAAVSVDEIDLHTGMLRFFRPKVNKIQLHRLSSETLQALQRYVDFGDMPTGGPLLRRSRKDGSLRQVGMSERAITQRVKDLGEAIGVFGLSAHDCRHAWATSAARGGTPPFDLQEAGGWSSLAMPRRYIAENEVANEGVKLD